MRIVLGLSVLAVTSASCGGKTMIVPDEDSLAAGGAAAGGVAAGGAAATAIGAGGMPSAPSGASGTTAASTGIPLSQTMGQVERASNALGIEGAVFAFGDPVSSTGLTLDVTQPGKACIKGIAARVMMPCLIVPPATDCYGVFFGAGLGENLDQMVGPATVGVPLAFNASGLKGFSFDVDGPDVPVPSSLRFTVEDATTQYGSPTAKSIVRGSNTMLFTDLVVSPWLLYPGLSADTAKSALIRMSWQIVTNTTSAVPFDFCVSNVRALLN